MTKRIEIIDRRFWWVYGDGRREPVRASVRVLNAIQQWQARAA